MEDKVYIVENVDMGTFHIYRDLNSACKYMREFYVNNFADWFSGTDREHLLDCIKEDLINLTSSTPFIEDVMYLHEATFGDEF